MDEIHASAIDRCDPGVEKEALALAAQAWPEAERAGHWQEIRAAALGRQGSDWILLAARRDESLLAAMLARQLPGRTALVWLPQLAGSQANPNLLRELLFSRLDEELKQAGVHV